MYDISSYILAIITAWFVAQGMKYIIAAIKGKTLRSFRHLYLSGNMPSSHSATVVALLVVVGCRDGFSSGLFGLAALFAAIVMYDAMMVRRSSGEQGEAIQALIHESNSRVPLPRAARGHTPLEVVVGAILGGVVGYIVFLAT